MAIYDRTCGQGKSCETICQAKKPGEECRLSFLDFALLLDAGSDVSPDGGEVCMPVLVM